MKKFFTMASLLALALTACSKDGAVNEAEGNGRVNVSCVAMTEVSTTRANVSCTTPSAEDFTLSIVGVDSDFAAEYATIAQFNENNYLHHGNYVATVVAGDLAEEGYDKATFVGNKQFAVKARQSTDVEITATIANALVVVKTTENFANYFAGGYALELTTAAGNKFDVTAQSEPLFIAPGGFTVSGTAVKQPNQSGSEGVEVTLPEYKNEAAQAQTIYTVKFDVENAGSATLNITLNDTLVESIDVEQELNDNAQ